jgi:hypothetical protein
MALSAVLDAARGSRSGRSKSKRSRLTRRSPHGIEPIEMRERRGRRYDVHAVERCWTVSRRGLGGQVERHCFRVRCREGTFKIHQDLRHNTWHLQR